MKKNRLESFSDGVFAIVITLLVLSINIPKVSYNELTGDLVNLLPAIGVYIMSFILIGMYWVFHHYAFSFLNEVDGVMVWLNILFLLFMSFIPYPTMLLGRYPYHTLPLIIYGVNLILANGTGFISIIYLQRNMQLASPVFTKKIYKSQISTYIIVNSMYIGFLAIAVYLPKISLTLFAIMAVFLIIRSMIFMGIGKCRIFSPVT